MTEITYRDAPLEPTERGYTLKSKDRLWTVFIFDLWSEDEFFGNRLFFTDRAGSLLTYEMWDAELLWTSRKEAEDFAQLQRDRYAETYKGNDNAPPEVYVINWGDDARFERELLEHGRYLERGKFAGSTAALKAMARRYQEHVEANR